MKKRLLIVMLVAMFMGVAVFAWGQSIFYEETFDTNQGWNLAPTWFMDQGVLKTRPTPPNSAFDALAISPALVVPALGADIVVHHQMSLVASDTDEIIVLAGGISTVIWSYDPAE